MKVHQCEVRIYCECSEKKEGELDDSYLQFLEEGNLRSGDEEKLRAIRRKSWRFAVINGGSSIRNLCLRPNARVRLDSLQPTCFKFGLPEEIISDNGKQFRDDPFKDWCEKLCINQHFASVKHPQTNGLVERANRNLDKGIKARTKAIIPTEIGMPTIRTSEVDQVQNNEALQINLDLLEERKEEAAIREAKRKLGPNGRDVMMSGNKALGKGSHYSHRDCVGKQLPRTWNISNLKKCYVHKM
ncbi:reverse transcriptase domain-containing protein [Tanacetum coccineum]